MRKYAIIISVSMLIGAIGGAWTWNKLHPPVTVTKIEKVESKSRILIQPNKEDCDDLWVRANTPITVSQTFASPFQDVTATDGYKETRTRFRIDLEEKSYIPYVLAGIAIGTAAVLGAKYGPKRISLGCAFKM